MILCIININNILNINIIINNIILLIIINNTVTTIINNTVTTIMVACYTSSSETSGYHTVCHFSETPLTLILLQ